MPDQPGGLLLSDVALARRIEAADAAVGVTSAEIHASLHPEDGAVAEPIAGGVAVYVGVHSPLTQALGIGMRGVVRGMEMDRLERFFTSRGARVQIEVCPLADPTLIGELGARGYHLREFSNMLVRKIRVIEMPPAGPTPISVQLSSPEEADIWARTVATGFGEDLAQPSENLSALRDLVLRPTTKCVLAWVEGRPAGGARCRFMTAWPRSLAPALFRRFAVSAYRARSSGR
jgi:hypothetical protein